MNMICHINGTSEECENASKQRTIMPYLLYHALAANAKLLQ
jgi:hypothetical protein